MLTPACFPSLGKYEASKTDCRTQLTDDQWNLIEDLFDWQAPSRMGGRPIVPPRIVLEALLWLLRNGGRWQDLPNWAPSESTCRRRLQQWTQQGLLAEVWARLVELADELGHIDWKLLIADGTFCPCKKGGNWLVPVTKGPAPQLWC